MMKTYEELVAGGWEPHPKVMGMRAPKTYPQGAAQFDPKWYLMHFTDVNGYVGPFDTRMDASLYRHLMQMNKYAVVRTSKPRTTAKEPWT